jgi:hypothetical protein
MNRGIERKGKRGGLGETIKKKKKKKKGEEIVKLEIFHSPNLIRGEIVKEIIVWT